MKLIDIHAHLEHKRFAKDLGKVIERCRKNNVLVIASGVNKTTNRIVLELSKKYPDVVKISFGIYPLDALEKEIEKGEADGFPRDIEKFNINEELRWIEEHKDDCVAIGECGLDYNWKEFQSEKQKQEQKTNFIKILKLAKKINKPVIIHSRKAEQDAIEILEEEKIKKVVMHCFSAKKGLVKKARDNGWYFSIPPIIIRLHHFKNLVSLIPIKQLLTETDSPYLSPKAGERNEPSNVSITIKEIAKIKNLSEDEVANQIWENAEKLFF